MNTSIVQILAMLAAIALHNGTYNVVLTVTDKDGGITTQAIAVTVENVAPAIVVGSKK